VYVGSGDGRFYVLDLASGARLWEHDMAGPVSASPAIASGRIVIGSQDGRLVCFG
jgi:outer membrane protein assembly factor BamB